MAISWDRKYRPVDFDSYVGNKIIKSRLGNALKQNKLPQSMLLVGSMGTGKTTLARLLAMSIMCKHRTEDGLACGKCDTCKYIKEHYIEKGEDVSNFTNIHEFDITKFNSVADAKAMVTKMSAKNFSQSARVYILDEMQRATKEAQSSFLKVLEEPVSNVYVIACTTDEEQLLPPLRSRFIRYEVKRPRLEEIVERLIYICHKEGVPYQIDALAMIVRKSDRVLRSSLKNAERLSLETGLTVDKVAQVYDEVDSDRYFGFLDTIMYGDLGSLFKYTDDLTGDSVDFRQFFDGLGEYLVNLINAKCLVKVEGFSKDLLKLYRKMLKNLGLSDGDLAVFISTLADFREVKVFDNYLVYALAVKLQQAYYAYHDMGFKEPRTTERKVNEVKAEKKYREVTKGLADSKKTVTPDVVSGQSVLSLFDNAKEVKLKGQKEDAKEVQKPIKSVELPKAELRKQDAYDHKLSNTVKNSKAEEQKIQDALSLAESASTKVTHDEQVAGAEDDAPSKEDKSKTDSKGSKSNKPAKDQGKSDVDKVAGKPNKDINGVKDSEEVRGNKSNINDTVNKSEDVGKTDNNIKGVAKSKPKADGKLPPNKHKASEAKSKTNVDGTFDFGSFLSDIDDFDDLSK